MAAVLPFVPLITSVLGAVTAIAPALFGGHDDKAAPAAPAAPAPTAPAQAATTTALPDTPGPSLQPTADDRAIAIQKKRGAARRASRGSLASTTLSQRGPGSGAARGGAARGGPAAVGTSGVALGR